MDGKTQTCLRILGILLLVLIFTLQAQASFSVKPSTDLSAVLENSQLELRETIRNYETDFRERLTQETAAADQNIIPNWSFIAANRGK